VKIVFSVIFENVSGNCANCVECALSAGMLAHAEKIVVTHVEDCHGEDCRGGGNPWAAYVYI